MNAKVSSRRLDLDWLRVFAIFTVFIFHNGRFFDTEGWHVKNPTTNFGSEVITYFLVSWIMPLIFVISGASLFYAVGKGGPVKFIKDKVLRLLVPLAAGACTHVAVQVYAEYRFWGRFDGSFIKFLPVYFDGLRDFGGNFAWTGLHLWYLLALFVLSVAFLPLFIWLKKGSGKRLLIWLGDFLAKPGAVYLLVIPGLLLTPLLNPESFWTSRDWGGWGLPMYIPLFLAGFIIISHEGLQERIRKQRWISLIAVPVIFFGALGLYFVFGDPLFGTTFYNVFFGLFHILTWAAVLAVLGFGLGRWNADTPFLKYANEAILPFYCLHQSVIICIGYFVVRWPIPDLLKFVIITSSSFITIMGIYEILIRRINVMRFLFGMKLLPKKSVEVPAMEKALQPKEVIS